METWRQIPVAPDYEISDLGNIRRIPPPKKNRVYNNPTPYLSKKGYAYISLRIDGKPRTFQHHRLVMLAFRGPSNLQVNHINGVKDDNRLSNLEYVTPKENQRHSRDVIDTFCIGTRNWNAKLNDDKVREIFKLNAQGIGSRRLAARFGVSKTMILYILRGKWWKHVRRENESPAAR